MVGPARVLQGAKYAGLGYLVEENPVHLLLGQLEVIGDEIGDGFTLAVRVSGQKYPVGILGGLGYLTQHLFLAGDDPILQGEFVLRIHRQFLGGKIDHVPVGGENPVILAQDPPDGLGLGG